MSATLMAHPEYRALLDRQTREWKTGGAIASVMASKHAYEQRRLLADLTDESQGLPRRSIALRKELQRKQAAAKYGFGPEHEFALRVTGKALPTLPIEARFPCETCGAPVMQKCRTKSGVPMSEFHAPRVKAARGGR